MISIIIIPYASWSSSTFNDLLSAFTRNAAGTGVCVSEIIYELKTWRKSYGPDDDDVSNNDLLRVTGRMDTDNRKGTGTSMHGGLMILAVPAEKQGIPLEEMRMNETNRPIARPHHLIAKNSCRKRRVQNDHDDRDVGFQT